MDLLATPADELNDAVKDLYVAAVTARDGKLNTKSADALSERLRWHAERMALSHQRDLLHEAANALEQLSNATTRIKARTDRTRAKASRRVHIVNAVRPEPSVVELVRQADAEAAMAGPAFDASSYEAQEAERVAYQNASLEARNRGFEEQRAHQVEADEPQPEPWWRR